MASVGVRELKQRTSALLRRVRDHGEEVDVTLHGRVIARLVPVRPAAAARGRRRAAWTDLDRLVTQAIIPERAAKLTGKGDVKDAQAAMAAEWDAFKKAWSK